MNRYKWFVLIPFAFQTQIKASLSARSAFSKQCQYDNVGRTVGSCCVSFHVANSFFIGFKLCATTPNNTQHLTIQPECMQTNATHNTQTKLGVVGQLCCVRLRVALHVSLIYGLSTEPAKQSLK